MKDTFLSIVIPTRNEDKNITECIKSIQKAIKKAKLKKTEILVVDGNSIDETGSLAKSLGAKVILNPGLTVVNARNLGIREARGEIIAFTDADCRVDENWINNALKYFEEKNICGVGGKILNIEEREFSKAVNVLFNLSVYLTGSVQGEAIKGKTVKDIPGCNAFYRRSCLIKIIPIDPELLTADDVELNFRLREKGCTLLRSEDVIVNHYRRDNPKGLFKQIYRFARGRVQVGKKSLKMINLNHILVAFVLPILLLTGLILTLNGLGWLIVLGFFLMLGIILIITRSFALASNLFLVFFIIIIAWSFGFWREILFK